MPRGYEQGPATQKKVQGCPQVIECRFSARRSPFWPTSRNSDYHQERRTRGSWTPPTRRVSRAARHDPARKITHQPTPQVGTSLQRMIAAKKRAAHKVRILSKPYPRRAGLVVAFADSVARIVCLYRRQATDSSPSYLQSADFQPGNHNSHN
jgi:hypothetical protein